MKRETFVQDLWCSKPGLIPTARKIDLSRPLTVIAELDPATRSLPLKCGLPGQSGNDE